jgi:GT2 family glycosyltransferase/SAM-dependent methyltransferase/glycosyltransferase involved in cell wall biosynthesis
LIVGRRAGAPRLIEWTGERCVPWAPDVQVVYEHLHRYLWAAQLVEGRRVLDLASGEGFGAAILARSASSVLGIDIDRPTVDHSSLNYGGETIEFRLGDAQDLSSFENDSFGAVVAFEMIEHVEDQKRVLAEITRVLEADGLLIMSTPERRAYSSGEGRENPFHVHELELPELRELLGRHFEHAAVWGQRTITGSMLSALGRDDAPASAPMKTFFVEPEGEEWSLASGMSALYLVAVASNAPLPAIATNSTLADCDLALLRAAERRGEQAARDGLRLGEERAEAVIGQLEAARAQLTEVRRALADREIELHSRRLRMEEVEQAVAKMRELEADLEVQRAMTSEMQQSITWRLFRAVRDTLLELAGGRESVPVRAARKAIRVIGRGAQRRSFAAAWTEYRTWPVILLPEFPEPHVSLVIPLYSGAQLTLDALRSILDRTTGVSYEVILVDDGADADTKALLKQVDGARIIVNKKNIGYLRSVNRGAAAARGKWIVLCNDIQVLEGWLASMVDCAESAPDIAIVTPKYLSRDWSLSEAGGVIWRDGSGGNYGRGDRPSDFRYEYRREVDYGSAAALMVQAEFWRECGGFDERYAPMYYEDTDLCFRARERGLRVMYEPRANVIHLEGGTAGTDISSGHKRWQEVNRVKFVERWSERLVEQLPPSAANARAAADRHEGPHLLIVDHRVPMWDRDSGSLRLRGMIDALLELGWRITFLPDDHHMVLPYTQELQAMGVEVMYGEFDPVSELTELAPGLDAILTCRPHATTHYLDLLRGLAPGVPVIYDTVDLHWLRESRRAALEGGNDRPPRVVALREIELALIRATDATLVVTEAEKLQVEADVPDSQVHVIANVNQVQAEVPPAHTRHGIVFVGGFEHTPNVDAVLLLINAVMPTVWRELGDVPVTIVGDTAPDAVKALASSQVDIAGWVHDLGPVLDRARAMVAPLTYGAGLKGKVTQALAAGLPVVTTPVGAEGLDARDGEQMLIGEDIPGLAERVVRLLKDDALWSRLSAEGQTLARDRCSPRLVKERLSALMESLGVSQTRLSQSDPPPGRNLSGYPSMDSDKASRA